MYVEENGSTRKTPASRYNTGRRLTVFCYYRAKNRGAGASTPAKKHR